MRTGCEVRCQADVLIGSTEGQEKVIDIETT